MNFDEAFTKLLGHEGGYSNHPSSLEIEEALTEAINKRHWVITKKPVSERACCSIDGCGRPLVGGGLCNGHYIRKKKGQSLEEPLKVRKRDGECSQCSEKIDSKGGWGLCRKHYRQERVTTIKETLISLFGGKCLCCKQQYPKHVFDFHHLRGKELSPSFLITNHSAKRIAEELSNCILLCANCHRMVHHGF